MKLYYNPMSYNCRKVTFVLNHINHPAELQVVDLLAGQSETPEFLKMNPNGMIPVLEDGNFHIWESNAIMQYIVEKKGSHELWPQDMKMRSDINRWQCWQLAHWGPTLEVFVWEHLFKPMMGQGSPDSGAISEATKDLSQYARILEDQLRGKKFITGNTLTLADISIGMILMYSEQAKFPLSQYSNIQEWFLRIEKMDAWKKTQPPKH